MRLAVLLLTGLLAVPSGPVGAEAPTMSLRPPSFSDRTSLAQAHFVSARPDAVQFSAWKRDFRDGATARGIRGDLYDRVMRDVDFAPDILKRDRNQAEFTKTIWNYLGTAVSAARIKNGKAAQARHARDLRRIQRRFGVEAEIVLAIWGLESAYGRFRGNESTIRALSTLAYDARRAEFFQAQLIAAFEILQAGDVAAADMRGSWAGAMGHTQFMPTSFLDHAVDFTGDGRRDVWSDDPRDALASTAAYLRHFGWKTGQPWGVEVSLPNGFDYALADRKIKKSPKDWARMGLRDMSGRAVPNHGPASILLPAGARGAAFMIFDNFAVIERYNPADAYVIGVGHLADRIAGGDPIRGGWPLEDRALSFDERTELQRRLTRAGFDTQKIDGRIGPLTIAAIRAWQAANGWVPDGYASMRLLAALR